ncbi:MAG: LacI family DNA-binding transcriptional regulator [Acidobacteriaceae bacterium]|nr:LacI family DNA-binding transcriptional regulator [Acidobacteriaceae bacterium]MBV8573199.1 LacI family DNA-binding transcriptional regulator [Acidobacteriaceae bacterium]
MRADSSPSYMAISIKDLARMAGVSHSTVSRALRNSPLIPQTTSIRIQQLAKEHGYTASAIARSLVTQKTQAVGVVVTTIADPFNGELLSGIEETAKRHGYSVILANSQADPSREVEVVRSFQERRVDGILVASSRVGAQYNALLADLGIPIVLLNNQHPDAFVYSITIDNIDGAYRATRHLIDLGHERIAYIGDRFGLQSDAQRLQGFRNALRRAGIAIDPELVFEGDGKPAAGAEIAGRLLSMKRPPAAIFCYNDMTALGVLEQARRRRISVPGQVSVVGFDDLFFAALLNPPLTTVRQPRELLGRRGMEMLAALLSNEPVPQPATIKGTLIVRESTGPPSATNRSQTGRMRRPGRGSKA